MRLSLLLLGLFILPLSGAAYSIHGKITDIKGEPIGFCNIYINGTSITASANGSGVYQIEVPAGKYQVIFQHLGYKQKMAEVQVSKDQELDVSLELLEYEVGDVVINASNDPANAIIKQAIAKRKYFLDAVESYSCDAYVKGMQRITEAPPWAKKRLEKAGITLKKNGTAILYLSESQSKLYYKKPGKFHEVVYSSKVSGQSQNFTFNSAQDFYFNFYERNITIPYIATRPFISPLNENAFQYYKFKMLGAAYEGDKLVYKIQVIPKSKTSPCFSGVLSLVDNNWNIHSLELYITKDNGIEYIDTLKVTQYFIPIKDDLWLPSQQRYDAKAGFLGLKGDGYYIGVFKNYQLNNRFGTPAPIAKVDSTAKSKKELKKEQKAETKLDKKIFTPEIIKIEDNANKHDTAYWDSIRPIPLTELEIDDYTTKDSIQTIKDSKAYKDSTDKEVNRPGFLGILAGYTLRKQYKKIYINFPALFSVFNFNTVEGPNLQLKFTVSKLYKTGGLRISFEPAFRYGFTNKEVNGVGTLNIRTGEKHAEYITLSGGKFISQFNDEQPQYYFGNTLKSLVLRINTLKIYEQYFAKLTYTREVYNGIFTTLSLQYAKRYPLENTNLYSFFPKVKYHYTPNGVDLPGTTTETDNITPHTGLLLNLNLHFVFGQQYITRPDFKIRTPSNYPELSLTYKKAIPIKGFSDLNFDFLEAQIRGSIPMKLAGTLQYRFGGGGFPNAKNIQYDEYKHFFGRFSNLGETELLGFYTLGFYRHSTDKYFAEAHLEQHFGGALFDRIPGWNKLKFKEVLGFHFLYTPVRQQYFQLDAGIENILKILRIDFVAGFGSQKGEYYFGARTGLAIDFQR